MAGHERSVDILIDELNAPDRNSRLRALGELNVLRMTGAIPDVPAERDVNNHIHTTFSFSPYSPTKAVWMAARAGLETAGIMDHESVSGIREFLAAGKTWRLPVTVGAEMRVSFAETPLAGRRINNPDQDSIAYVALHAIPHQRIDAVAAFFRPLNEARERRNRLMTERLGELLKPAGLSLDYDMDVLPLSQAAEGGSVTERHLLFAVAEMLLYRFGAAPELVRFLSDTMGIAVSAKAAEYLTDSGNSHIQYDLLGVLKSDLVEQFYVDATTAECPPVAEVTAFCRENGIILAYAYLGDVGQSVTGDKKTQKFEDDYLDELFDVLEQLGFGAVTYMPSRNTREQLLRVRDQCERRRLFQISGEDINSPRQSFVCVELRDPLFANLYDAAWALIGHEQVTATNLDEGLLGSAAIAAQPELQDRVIRLRDLALAEYGR